MLEMEVHVPIEEPVNEIHFHRAAIEPVVQHILRKARVLRVAVDRREPGAIEVRAENEEEWKPCAIIEAQANHARVDQGVDPRAEENLRVFRFRQVCGLFRRNPPEAMKRDVFTIASECIEVNELEKQSLDVWRARDMNFGVASHDDRIAMVARMAPPPWHGFTHDHKGGNLVEQVVQPIRLESRAVPGLVPTGIRGRGVKHAVNHQWKNRPPTRPPRPRPQPGCKDKPEIDQAVANGRPVLASQKLTHFVLGNRRGIPIGFGEPESHGALGFGSGETIVFWIHTHPEHHGICCKKRIPALLKASDAAKC